MADLTIRVDAAHVPALRAGIMQAIGVAARGLAVSAEAQASDREAAADVDGHRRELADLEDAFEQLRSEDAEVRAAVLLTGHPEVLSDAVHAALRTAIRLLLDDAERYWHGAGDRAAVAGRLRAVAELVELLAAVQEPSED